MQRVYAIRGATTVSSNNKKEIIEATQDMLKEIFRANNVLKENIISMLFTMTEDLDAVFPAKAARMIGITDSALICTKEISVPDSLEKCIRVMIHCYLPLESEIRHIYHKEARKLRPDLMEN